MTVCDSSLVSPEAMSRRVRVSVMVNPDAPPLALHASPSGIVMVCGLVGRLRELCEDVTS